MVRGWRQRKEIRKISFLRLRQLESEAQKDIRFVPYWKKERMLQMEVSLCLSCLFKDMSVLVSSIFSLPDAMNPGFWLYCFADIAISKVSNNLSISNSTASSQFSPSKPQCSINPTEHPLHPKTLPWICFCDILPHLPINFFYRHVNFTSLSHTLNMDMLLRSVRSTVIFIKIEFKFTFPIPIIWLQLSRSLLFRPTSQDIFFNEADQSE